MYVAHVLTASASMECIHCVAGSRMCALLHTSLVWLHEEQQDKGGDDEEEHDASEGQMVLPQVPGCSVGHTLALQVVVASVCIAGHTQK